PSAWRFRQTATRGSLPRAAGVMRHEDAAARAAAEHGPRVHDCFPSARHQSLGIAGIDREPRAAGVLVHEENAAPVLAAIHGAENAALLLRAGETSGGARINDIGVGGVDDHP